MQSTPLGPSLGRGILAKLLRDLVRLPPNARRIDVEAAVWRSVTRHAGVLTAEQTAEVTWRIIEDLGGGKKAA